jgi:hypothetical protein
MDHDHEVRGTLALHQPSVWLHVLVEINGEVNGATHAAPVTAL